MIGYVLTFLAGVCCGFIGLGIFATGGRRADDRAARVLPFRPPRVVFPTHPRKSA